MYYRTVEIISEHNTADSFRVKSTLRRVVRENTIDGSAGVFRVSGYSPAKILFTVQWGFNSQSSTACPVNVLLPKRQGKHFSSGLYPAIVW